MDNILIFSNKLKELLEENELSAEQLSKITGQNVDYIYAWKSGKADFLPSLDNIIKLADIFHCSVEFLLGITDFNNLTNPKPMQNFSQRFPVIVKEKGFNLHRLAKETGMNNTITYYSWINGKSNPSIDSLIRIASVLNCSIDYLLGRE